MTCIRSLLLTLVAAPALAAAPIQVHIDIEDLEAVRPHACAAWSSAQAFARRDDPATAVALGHATRTSDGWVCTLTLPDAGVYALAVMDDVNGNGKVDTNWLGAPTEAWGTSNNVVPPLRAPSFDESKLTLADGQRVRIEVHR